jgi:hypothetical protein
MFVAGRNDQDFGTSRWQLRQNATQIHEGAEGATPTRDFAMISMAAIVRTINDLFPPHW